MIFAYLYMELNVLWMMQINKQTKTPIQASQPVRVNVQPAQSSACRKRRNGCIYLEWSWIRMRMRMWMRHSTTQFLNRFNGSLVSMFLFCFVLFDYAYVLSMPMPVDEKTKTKQKAHKYFTWWLICLSTKSQPIHTDHPVNLRACFANM